MTTRHLALGALSAAALCLGCQQTRAPVAPAPDAKVAPVTAHEGHQTHEDHEGTTAKPAPVPAHMKHANARDPRRAVHIIDPSRPHMSILKFPDGLCYRPSPLRCPDGSHPNCQIPPPIQVRCPTHDGPAPLSDHHDQH